MLAFHGLHVAHRPCVVQPWSTETLAGLCLSYVGLCCVMYSKHPLHDNVTTQQKLQLKISHLADRKKHHCNHIPYYLETIPLSLLTLLLTNITSAITTITFTFLLTVITFWPILWAVSCVLVYCG